MNGNKVILCILDGWGIAPAGPGNAITLADPPTYKYLLDNFPHSQLEASGIAVGLPTEQDGNTETGHLNIGAGRIIYQDLARINLSIADGSFFTNEALIDAINYVKKNNSTLHLLGLIGSSGVHAYNEHLYALIMMAVHHKVEKLNLHLITDGRDSPPFDSINQITKIQERLHHYQIGKIASLMGRYYAMDRDQHLDRTKLAFECLVKTTAPNQKSAAAAIQLSYENKVTDEFIKPVSIGEQPQDSRLKDNDALIFYNYRIDRSRQLTKMILDAAIPNLKVVTMTKYHDDFEASVAYPDNQIKNTLGEIISSHNLKQLRAAESEKERFVTYYFNGQHEEPYSGEERLIVPSPRVATYDLAPAMSTKKLVGEFSQRYIANGFSLGVLNIACPDMVAHTGDIVKTKVAVMAADEALASLIKVAQQTKSYLLITGDHGNAEELLSRDSGQLDTEHSLYPVPFIIYSENMVNQKVEPGVLADIAPTILSILGIKKPPEMTGTNLLVSI